jgi:hypothetical protein
MWQNTGKKIVIDDLIKGDEMDTPMSQDEVLELTRACSNAV